MVDNLINPVNLIFRDLLVLLKAVQMPHPILSAAAGALRLRIRFERQERGREGHVFALVSQIRFDAGAPMQLQLVLHDCLYFVIFYFLYLSQLDTPHFSKLLITDPPIL